MPLVTVYSQPGCAPCNASKRKLDKLGISYVEKDVSTDSEAREKVISLGFQATPVIIVEDHDVWSGFRPEKIEGILSLATS